MTHTPALRRKRRQSGRVGWLSALLVGAGALALLVWTQREPKPTPRPGSPSVRTLPGAPAALSLPAGAEPASTPAAPAPLAASSGGVSVAPTAGAGTSSAAVESLPSLGWGLTLARAPLDGRHHAVAFACGGDPEPQDRPLRGACDPARGDTSCRAVLPLLCARAAGLMAPDGLAEGWSGAELGAAQPVMGAVLSSAAAADARCQAELGPGWRMADWRAGSLVGARGAGLPDRPMRYWVRAEGPANCWDGAAR